MLKNKKILLTILMVVLLLLIPNIVKADDQEIVTSISITVPEPVIGEKPAYNEQIEIEAVTNKENKELEVNDVGWEFYNENDGGGTFLRRDTETFEKDKNYRVNIIYALPADVTVDSNLQITINGQTSNINYSGAVNGTPDVIYYMVTYTYGKAKEKPKTPIKTIDFSIPTPVVGKTQYGIEDAIVKINNSEKMQVIGVAWDKYNEKENKYDDDSAAITQTLAGAMDSSYINNNPELFKLKKFEENKKYAVEIIFICPNTYEYSDDVVVRFNGEIIPFFTSAITTEVKNTFIQTGSGDTNGAFDGAIYVLGEPKIQAKEVEKETPDTKVEKTKEETPAEKAEGKKDETKAPGTIPHAGGTLAIIASAVLLIAGGIFVFRKNNDLKGI